MIVVGVGFIAFAAALLVAGIRAPWRQDRGRTDHRMADAVTDSIVGRYEPMPRPGEVVMGEHHQVFVEHVCTRRWAWASIAVYQD